MPQKLRVENPISITHRLRDWIRRLINQTIDYFHPTGRPEGYVMSSREIRARELFDEAINMTQPRSIVPIRGHSVVRERNDHTSPSSPHRALDFEKNNSRRRPPCSETVGPLDSL